MDGSGRAAEDHADYRFFRGAAILSSRLVMACLFLVAWNFAFFSNDRETLVFLGSTGGLALVVSLGAAMTSYALFRRRGGKVEKTPRPFPR